jgi:hypothetical protein
MSRRVLLRHFVSLRFAILARDSPDRVQEAQFGWRRARVNLRRMTVERPQSLKTLGVESVMDILCQIGMNLFHAEIQSP